MKIKYYTINHDCSLDLKRYNLSRNNVIANVVLHDMFRPMRKLKKRVRRKKFVQINFDPKVVLHDICKVLEYDNKDNISTKASTLPKTSLTTDKQELTYSLGIIMALGLQLNCYRHMISFLCDLFHVTIHFIKCDSVRTLFALF